MFLQIFGTPHDHPKSKPFFDRVMSFAIVDNRIWIRNYQVMKVNIKREACIVFKNNCNLEQNLLSEDFNVKIWSELLAIILRKT